MGLPKKIFRYTLGAVGALILIGCEADKRAEERGALTLYRSSAIAASETIRIHVATFDNAEGFALNRAACNAIAKTVMDSPGVTVTYWCEPGYYRP